MTTASARRTMMDFMELIDRENAQKEKDAADFMQLIERESTEKEMEAEQAKCAAATRARRLKIFAQLVQSLR